MECPALAAIYSPACLCMLHSLFTHDVVLRPPCETDLHVLAHGNALAGFELGAFVPIILQSPDNIDGVCRSDPRRVCRAALMLTVVAAASAGLDLEAAATSPRALLRSLSRLGGRQGYWDGPRAKGAASARLRAAMGAPCSRTSGSPSSDGPSWVRLLLCVDARKRTQAVRRSGKSRTDVWRSREQLGQ